MLKHLQIRNYALIKSLDLDFSEGLTTVTGETGAGKSILLGAIGLILGQRADSSEISSGENKCVIEASFEVSSLGLESVFESLGIDYENICILRREIHHTGKSRAFVNDTPVNLTDLKLIGNLLVEIQTQHANLMVAQTVEQRKILDFHFADLPNLSEYQLAYSEYKKAVLQLDKKQLEKSELLKNKDYNEFLLNELSQLSLNIELDQQLDQEIELLSQVEKIKTAFNYSIGLLDNDQTGILNGLNSIKNQLKAIKDINPEIASFYDRIDSTCIELKELNNDLWGYSENIEEDPQKLELLNQRQSKIQNLLKKHQVETIQQLTEIEQRLSNELLDVSELENQIIKLQNACDKSRLHCVELARKLTEKRKESASVIENKAVTILQNLGLSHAQLGFEVHSDYAKLSDSGCDEVQLLFSANLGSPKMPVGQVASGGEISRLNFAIRSIVAKKKNLPTLIYDEADTGISGEVAGKMGKIFKELGSSHQVICITHLPQVASCGNQQLFVKKAILEGKTITDVSYLSDAERIESIASMLSGDTISDSARNTAKELLGL
jgi:DNA repair protein RecN (Recombination protein N)